MGINTQLLKGTKLAMAGIEGQPRIPAPMGLEGGTHTHTHLHTHLSLHPTGREWRNGEGQSEDHNIKDRHKRGDDKNDDVGKKE